MERKQLLEMEDKAFIDYIGRLMIDKGMIALPTPHKEVIDNLIAAKKQKETLKTAMATQGFLMLAWLDRIGEENEVR